RENVHLWMATQALASLPETVAEAARTNAADFVLFRGSPDEARQFHRWLPNVSEESLLSLSTGQALVLAGKGEDVEWTSIDRAARPLAVEEALREARDASQALWGQMDGDEHPEVPGRSDGVRPTAESRRDPEVERILLVLWAGVLDADPAPEIVVALGPLRDALDPSGHLLRTVGSILARSGVLAETKEAPGGRVWRLVREPFGALFPGGVDPEGLARATSVWRGIASPGGASG
ncbi:MAG TPA: hypothetical protein VGS23_08300, partial [Thermoplasmata archaeon]|nr:hypothetical protein [Thermoplasmata archaeon]